MDHMEYYTDEYRTHYHQAFTKTLRFHTYESNMPQQQPPACLLRIKQSSILGVLAYRGPWCQVAPLVVVGAVGRRLAVVLRRNVRPGDAEKVVRVRIPPDLARVSADLNTRWRGRNNRSDDQSSCWQWYVRTAVKKNTNENLRCMYTRSILFS